MVETEVEMPHARAQDILGPWFSNLPLTFPNFLLHRLFVLECMQQEDIFIRNCRGTRCLSVNTFILHLCWLSGSKTVSSNRRPQSARACTHMVPISCTSPHHLTLWRKQPQQPPHALSFLQVHSLNLYASVKTKHIWYRSSLSRSSVSVGPAATHGQPEVRTRVKCQKDPCTSKIDHKKSATSRIHEIEVEETHYRGKRHPLLR